MLNIKRDIKRQDLKAVDLHFPQSIIHHRSSVSRYRVCGVDNNKLNLTFTCYHGYSDAYYYHDKSPWLTFSKKVFRGKDTGHRNDRIVNSGFDYITRRCRIKLGRFESLCGGRCYADEHICIKYFQLMRIECLNYRLAMWLTLHPLEYLI